jgi:hypothetical protein
MVASEKSTQEERASVARGPIKRKDFFGIILAPEGWLRDDRQGRLRLYPRKDPAMADNETISCPECAGDFPEVGNPVNRRSFLRVGGGTAALAALGSLDANAPPTQAAAPIARKPKPAEDLIRELYTNLKENQKKRVGLPMDHKTGKLLTRLKIVNSPIGGVRIDKAYTKPQQELIERIVKAICSDEDGYRRISRNYRWDDSGSLGGCSGTIFGDPTAKTGFAFVLAGHHLTIRCDGEAKDGIGFGGPMYYGHSPHGYSRGNVFYYQTKSVLKVYDALSEKQRKQAVVKGSPGELEPSIQFRKKSDDLPGIHAEDLSKDQLKLVEQVMRDILSPYRKDDVDEVMEIVKKNGGMSKIHLAFYPDSAMKSDAPWHFWRLEGPGFIWNYRVLDHVHTYVNVSSNI